MTKELKLEVAKKYINGKGDIIEIVSKSGCGCHPLCYAGVNLTQSILRNMVIRNSYNFNGAYRDAVNHEKNLIKEREPMATKIKVGKKYNIPGMPHNPYKVIYDIRAAGFKNHTEHYVVIGKEGQISAWIEPILANATEHREPVKNSAEGYIVYDPNRQPDGTLLDQITGGYCYQQIFSSSDQAKYYKCSLFPEILKGRFTFEEIIK